MCGGKRIVLAVMVICVGFAGVCSAGSEVLDMYLAQRKANAAKSKHPTAMELIDKYAETQEKLQSSFIIRSEDITENPEKKGRVCETRYDGNKLFWVEKHWGTKFFVKGKEGWATKESPSYLYFMWDGDFIYSHNRGGDRPGGVIINAEKMSPDRYTLKNSPEKGFAGYCYGNYDRIDQVLRRYNNIQIDPNMEKVAGYNCYHIRSKTKEGTFNIWISPQLDYNIVKMTASYKEGDIFCRVPVPETGKIIWQIEITDFRQVAGIWVPMEYRQKLNRRIPARDHKIVSDFRRKRTEVILNPDHEALNSFGTNFIPNGADTRIVELGMRTRFVWQDGKLIDPEGNKLDLKNILNEAKKAGK